MKAFLKTIFCVALIALTSCAKQPESELYKPGKCLDTHFVTAESGNLSVLVDTKGTWRVSCDDSWVSFDVAGGVDRQAFTLTWESNESDVLSVKSTRKADILIRRDDSMMADTLRLVQQGFIRKDYPMTGSEASGISLEYVKTTPKTMTLICCSAEGCSQEELQTWAESQADVVVMGECHTDNEGIRVAGCDFKGLDADSEYTAFTKLISETINSSPKAGSDWVICGQMYHRSQMQVGYPSTPQGYENGDFRSDVHAWQNNMYDVVWMKMQDYVTTYTDENGFSYAADYVYVSATLLPKVYDVEVLACPLAGMKHNPIRLTLKF